MATDDEIEMLAAPARPGMKRYDKRVKNGQLEAQRHQARELRSIRRKQRKLIKWLEDANEKSELSQGLIAAKRLLADLYDKERDRIEGRPHTATPPPKPSQGDARLSEAVQQFIAGRKRLSEAAALEPSELEPEREPEPSDSRADMRELSRLRY